LGIVGSYSARLVPPGFLVKAASLLGDHFLSPVNFHAKGVKITHSRLIRRGAQTVKAARRQTLLRR